jgi:hypothetical protein
VLSSVGRLYVNYTAHRPAYQLVGGTVALLLFLYLFHQLLLYGAALAATGTKGTVVDLAAGPVPAQAPIADKSAPRRPTERMMGRVGALVTLQLPPDSPIRELPWIVTFGPLDDEADWEPVVCGPYEYPHALALAEEVVADDELMAVMEPVRSPVSPEEIRHEIDAARAAGEADFDPFTELDEMDETDHGADGEDIGHERAEPLPDPAEVRAGILRVTRRLAPPD